MKVWPIAFSENGRIWASDGMYYGYADWWNLLPGYSSYKSDLISLKVDGIYRVAVIMNEWCFARMNGAVYYTDRRNPPKWIRSTEDVLKYNKRGASFIYHSSNSSDSKPAIRKAPVYVPSALDWFITKSGCYFCGVASCEHIDRLVSK